MKLTNLKATLMVAFIFLTATLTYFGLNSNKGDYDFKKLEQESAIARSTQSSASFESLLKNIGSSTTLVKPDVLNSNDTNRLSLSIELLDSMKQYIYAGVLCERLAGINKSSSRYHQAARLYITATEKHENELMLYKKAKQNLEKSLELDSSLLDAQVDLAIAVFNVNLMDPPSKDDFLTIMRPTRLLLDVVKKDSNHIDAQYYLGKLAIESNQLEKAIVRFKKLVSLQPQNLEFYREIVELYNTMGNEKEAKVWAAKAMTVTKNKK